MKRILSLVLVFVSIFGILAIPARAAEEVDYLMELTEYGTMDDSGGFSRTLTSGNSKFFFRLPSYGMVYYVDMVLTCEFYPPDAVSCTINGEGYHTLNLVNISGDLYRVYGEAKGLGSTITFQFDLSGVMMPVTVHSCRVSLIEVSQFDITGECYLESTSGYSDTIYYNSADEINSRTLSSTGQNIKLLLTGDDWKKYDFLDFQILVTAADIHSISAYCGDLILPVEHSFIAVSTDRRDSFYVTMRVYIGDIKRTTSDVPTVRVDLNESGTNQTYISVEGMAGLIQDADANVFTHWFRKIVNGLDHILAALQYSEGSSDLKDKVSQSQEDLDEIGDVMASVTKPNPDDVDVDISDIVSNNDLSVSSSMLTHVFDSEYVGSMFIIVAILATVSFVFYGKR